MIVARRTLALIAAVATAAALALLPATAASAASSTGWLRLGHLSPDTKAVDVTLTRLSGGTVLYKLSEVAYGDVSPYMKLAAGTYTVSMVPAGMPADSTPVLKGAIPVTAGKAATLVAVGRNKDITPKLFLDDLSSPGTAARVRILQASVKHPTVTVRAGSATLATAARFGSMSSYSSLEAGTTTFALTSGSGETSARVELAAGTVHTVVVLDDAHGGLTVMPLLDSAAVTVPPVGAVETGGGALAGGDAAALATAGPAAAAAAAAAAVLVVAMLRRRPDPADRLDG
jgi:hypothetical protein